MPKFILQLLAIIRKPISRIVWFFVKDILAKPERGCWSSVVKQPLKVFNAIMSAASYRRDPFYGLLDYTVYDLDYYFFPGNDGKFFYGRDCDDAAHVWFNYLKEQNDVDEVYMILCIDGWNIASLHFFTVAKFSHGKYKLFNYVIHPDEFNFLDHACGVFEYEPLTVHGNYKHLTWVVYDKWNRFKQH